MTGNALRHGCIASPLHTAIDYVRRQAPDQEELSDNLAEPETDGPDEEEIQYSVAQIKEATKKLPAATA